MVSLFLPDDRPGVIVEDCVTADAAARLTGYNIQHLRRLCLAGRLDATHVGRSWLIKVKSIEAYLNEVVAKGDGRFGPHISAIPDSHETASA